MMNGTQRDWGEYRVEGLARPAAMAVPGLEAGRLHELHASPVDRGAALAFALALGAPGPQGRAFLLRESRRKGARGQAHVRLYGPGVAGLGLAAGGLVLIDAGDEMALLRAGLDAARCPGVAAVVIETRGRLAPYDLTASRRLALAAEHSGGRVIVLRIDAEPRPSAAFSRWAIASAPSVALEARAPGPPALEAHLQRRRGGAADLRWRLEWDEEHGTFREAGAGLPAGRPDEIGPDDIRYGPAHAALSGAVVSLAPLRGRTDGDGESGIARPGRAA